MASIQKRPNGKWRARYRDAAGKEHARHFSRKIDAQRWLDEVTADVVTGRYVDPRTARMTFSEWAETWLRGYEGKRPSTVRQARVHLRLLEAEFGDMPLASIRPSHVKAWTAKLASDGRAPSYVYAVYRRLAQVMGDAAHDGIIPRSPCSRRTSPQQGEQRPYVATEAQVWALHDSMPAHLAPAVLLGAFAGLRVSEAAGLRVTDIDFMRGTVTPAVQHGDAPLKTKASAASVPIPQDLALMLAASVERATDLAGDRATHVVTNELGRPTSPWAIERAIRAVRESVPGLPVGFRHHDLRHFYASTLIDAGLSVKVVQSCLRHKSATTTLNTYGHMFPDADESARAAIAAALTARADSVRTEAAT
ncbi:tyrosine-type recombinase/integrase [Georgenia sp. H159]|uniref:tyrosine-type recombinase/integrase n=1 Tax=Georgenia sp. H159 TaxID=3076115 RepID=UPI002D783DD9|nr:tyrosine-type recombinase/integrase [Georgenia sp. H159]